MKRILSVDDFRQYNGFYGRADCRSIIYQIYDGRCALCGDNTAGVHHVAHIIARSHPGLMESYLPGLDVDNLINLRLACASCNLREHNFVLDTPMLQHAFTVSARRVEQRFPAISDTTSGEPVIESTDPRLCCGAVHISYRDILANSSEWLDAVRMPYAYLAEKVENHASFKGRNLDEWCTRRAIEESFNMFDEHMSVDGRSLDCRGRGRSAWARHMKTQADFDRETRLILDGAENRLQDGEYLSKDDLAATDGLWIPIRTETQLWFRDVFRTILSNYRKLPTHREKNSCVVLEGWQAQNLDICARQLAQVHEGLGMAGRSPAAPPVLSHFSLDDGELWLSDLGVPSSVRTMLLESARSGVSQGAILRTAKFRNWLLRAFALAVLGLDNAKGDHLIQHEASMGVDRWVPQLPRNQGKTRAQVAREAAAENARRRRRRSFKQARTV